MKAAVKCLVAIAVLSMLAMSPSFAGDMGSKPEAIAMVKKAVDYIKANGTEKAYAEFSNKTGSFKDRDLYVVVYDTTGKCLAHGNNAKLVGKDLADAQDADGVYYVKKRIEMMKAGAPFWQDYKFSNPVTKKIEPKTTYCQVHNGTAVCVGVYN